MEVKCTGFRVYVSHFVKPMFYASSVVINLLYTAVGLGFIYFLSDVLW